MPGLGQQNGRNARQRQTVFTHEEAELASLLNLLEVKRLDRHRDIFFRQRRAGELQNRLDLQAGESLLVLVEDSSVLGLGSRVSEFDRRPSQLEVVEHVPKELPELRRL